MVCKHWLRGLCKKGDQCEFLHEYDMTKMPECYFYSKFGEAAPRGWVRSPRRLHRQETLGVSSCSSACGACQPQQAL